MEAFCQGLSEKWGRAKADSLVTPSPSDSLLHLKHTGPYWTWPSEGLFSVTLGERETLETITSLRSILTPSMLTIFCELGVYFFP